MTDWMIQGVKGVGIGMRDFHRDLQKFVVQVVRRGRQRICYGSGSLVL